MIFRLGECVARSRNRLVKLLYGRIKNVMKSLGSSSLEVSCSSNDELLGERKSAVCSRGRSTSELFAGTEATVNGWLSQQFLSLAIMM